MSSAGCSPARPSSHDGHVMVHEARVWSRPASPPPALRRSRQRRDGRLARRVGGRPRHRRPGARRAPRRCSRAYRDAPAAAGPAVLQVHVSLAPTDAEALAIAKDQWRNGLVSPPECWDIEQPEAFDDAAGEPVEAEMRRAVLISHDAVELAERIAVAGRSSASTACTCTTSARISSGSSSRAETELLPAAERRRHREDQRHQRPVVEDGGRSTASTSRRSSTATATGSATSPDSRSASTTLPTSG